MLNFIKSFFCIYLDDNLIFTLHFVSVVYHIDCFVDIKPALHPQKKYHLIIVYAPLTHC